MMDVHDLENAHAGRERVTSNFVTAVKGHFILLGHVGQQCLPVLRAKVRTAFGLRFYRQRYLATNTNASSVTFR